MRFASSQGQGTTRRGADDAHSSGQAGFLDRDRVIELGRDHVLAPNYRRMLVWLTLSALFWIGGAFAHHETRIALCLVAILIEYIPPMTGFRPISLRSKGIAASGTNDRSDKVAASATRH